MKDVFVVTREVNGVVKNKRVFSREKFSFLKQGMYYAKVKESGFVRKKAYEEIYNVLYEITKE